MTEIAKAPVMVSMDRVKGLSDGVIAIAITLLILNLELPITTQYATSAELWQHLITMAPQFAAYIMCFYLVGRSWYVHADLYFHVDKADGPIILLNMFYILFISFLPFPSMLMGHHLNSLSVIFFDLSVLAPSLMLAWSAHYLTTPFSSPRMFQLSKINAIPEQLYVTKYFGFIVMPIVSTISMLIAYFYDPNWAQVLWLILFAKRLWSPILSRIGLKHH